VNATPEFIAEKILEWEKRAHERAADRPGHYVPIDRVVPIIENWLADHRAKHNSHHNKSSGYGTGAGPKNGDKISSAGGMNTLSSMTGINVRVINRLLAPPTPYWRYKKSATHASWQVDGQIPYVTIDMLDRLLCGIGMVHLFALPPDQGGFSDIYWHESIINAPVLEVAA
jgi:hypothetical protein